MLTLKAVEVLCLVQVLFVIPSSSQGGNKSQTQKFCFFASSELIYENVMKQVAVSAKCEGGGRLLDNKVSLGGVQGIVDDYDSIWGAVYFVDETDYQSLLRYAQSRSQLSFMSQARISLPKMQMPAICRTIDIGVISSGFPFSSKNEATFESTVDQYVERMRQLGAPEKYLRKLTTAQKWIPPSFANNNLMGQSPKQNSMRRRVTTKIMNQKTSKRFTPYPLNPYPPADDANTLEQEQPLKPTTPNTPTTNQMRVETIKKESENLEQGVTQIVTENQSPGMPSKQQITTVPSNSGSPLSIQQNIRPVDIPSLSTDKIPIQKLQDQNPVNLEDGSLAKPLLPTSSPLQPIQTEMLDDKLPNSRYSRPIPLQNSPTELDRKLGKQNPMKPEINKPSIPQVLKPNESPREMLEELHYPGNPKPSTVQKSPVELYSQNTLEPEDNVSKVPPINSSPLLQTQTEMLEGTIINPREPKPILLENDTVLRPEDGLPEILQTPTEILEERPEDRLPKIPQLLMNNSTESPDQNTYETQDNTIPNEKTYNQPQRRLKKPKQWLKSPQNTSETLENPAPMKNDLLAPFSPQDIETSNEKPSQETLEDVCNGPSFKSSSLENLPTKQSNQNQTQTLDMLSDDSSEEIYDQHTIPISRGPLQEFLSSASVQQNAQELAKEKMGNSLNTSKKTLQDVQNPQSSQTELPQQNLNQPEDMLPDNSSEEVSDQLRKPQASIPLPLQTTSELVGNQMENPIPINDHPQEFVNQESTGPHINPQTPKEILDREMSLPSQERPAEQFSQNPITLENTSPYKKLPPKTMQRRNTPREVLEHEIRNRRKPLPMQNQPTKLQNRPQNMSPNYESDQSITKTDNNNQSIDNTLPAITEDRPSNTFNPNPWKPNSTPLQNNSLGKECSSQFMEPTSKEDCLPNTFNQNPCKSSSTPLQNNLLGKEYGSQLTEPTTMEDHPPLSPCKLNSTPLPPNNPLEKQCSPQLTETTVTEDCLPNTFNQNPYKLNSTQLQNNALEKECSGPTTIEDHSSNASEQSPNKLEDKIPNESAYDQSMIPPKRRMQQLSPTKPGLSNNPELSNGPIFPHNPTLTPLQNIPKQGMSEVVAHLEDSESMITQGGPIKCSKILEKPKNTLPNRQILEENLPQILSKQHLLQNTPEKLEEKIENPQCKISKLNATSCQDAPEESLKDNACVSEPLSQERDSSKIIQQKLQEKTEKAAQDLNRTIKEVLASPPDTPRQPNTTTIISSNGDNPTILANDKPITASNSDLQDNPKSSNISDSVSILDDKLKNLDNKLFEEQGELVDENTLPLQSSSKVKEQQNSKSHSYSTFQSKQMETERIKSNQPQNTNSSHPPEVEKCSQVQTQNCKNFNQEVQENTYNTSILSSPDPQCKETPKNLNSNNETSAQSNAQANESIDNTDNHKTLIPGYTLGPLVPEFDVLIKAIEPTFLREGATASQTQTKNAISAASSELQQKQMKTASTRLQQTKAKSTATAGMQKPCIPDSPAPLNSMPASTSDITLAQVTAISPSTENGNTKITTTPISTPNAKGINIQTIHPNGISSATQITTADGSNKVSAVSVSPDTGLNRSGTKVMEMQTTSAPGSAMASSSVAN